jgi:formate dehydrogenase major subunit
MNDIAKLPAADSVTLNGMEYAIEPGETILALVRRHDMQQSIPTLCDDPRLKPYGACRVCSVELESDSGGQGRVVAACHTPVQAGMRINTDSTRINKLRRNIVELVLTDHPLDCLTCEVNGNCQLQDVAASVGIREVRYAQGANHQQLDKDKSHTYMRMDLSKCINCDRCVRACDEIQGSFVLNMSGRGFDAKIVKDADVPFGDSSCVSCGACAETCPTAAITDVFQSKSVLMEKTVRTVCSYCGVGCNLDVAVKNDQVLSIRAPHDSEVNGGHTCLKGRYAFRFYNHPDRLTQPLIKRNGQFQPAEWDEAYDYIAQRIESLVAEHGADSIAGISSARCTNEENYLMQKMMRAVIGTNNIDCCARVCHSPTAMGMQKSFGTGAATNSIAELDQANLIMLVGANPTNAHPVTGARIKQRVMQGATLIVIDPVKTELARYADFHLQLRPGTNVALLNMMLHYIDAGDLIDHLFVGNRCEGFGEFQEQIRAIDIEAMESISGVDRNLVKDAAHAYALSGKAMSFHGLGVTEHSQGSKTVMLLANLAMITGNIGRPGVGVNPLRGQNNVQGAADMGVQPHQGAGYLDVTQPEHITHYENAYGRSMPRTDGKKIPEMFDAALAGDLKALWIIGEDVVQTDPNSAHIEAAIKSLDFLVIQEIFLSETARLADVILPGTSFLEKEGTFTNGERRVQRVNQVVSPHGNSRPDGQILVEMMNRLGYPQPPYHAANTLEEIAAVVPFFEGIKWHELGDHGKQWPVDKNGKGTDILHTETFKRGLGKFHYFDFEETEELVSHLASFPLILTTSRDLVHYNSGTMTRRTENERIVDEDLLLIHPEDAEVRDIDSDDQVILFSDRGEIKIRAIRSTNVKPGILFTTFHFPELMVNRVTSDVKDEETLCPEYKVVAVDVRKFR